MAVDLVNVVTSAVVAGGVSLATASWKVGREERSRRAAAARIRVRDATTELLRLAVERAENSGQLVVAKTSGMSMHPRYTFASDVLEASEDLAWPRRRLVERRTRKLVGLAAFEAARISPGMKDAQGVNHLVHTMLKHQHNPKVLGHGTLALLDTNDAKPKALAKLVKSLRRLRNCR